MNLQALSNRTVLLWGLGREGWSVLRALKRAGVRSRLVVFTDTPLSSEETSSLKAFAADAGGAIEVMAGAELPAALRKAEVIVKSPGVSRYRAEIQDALRRGVPVSSASSLWFAEWEASRSRQGKLIVVSGTKGKSTTSLLIARLLQGLGKSVRLGGNIGTSLLDLLEDEAPVDYWVVELSSYQISDSEIRPDIAVLLNLYPEHVDWHGTVEIYYRDKVSLLSRLDENAIAILNRKSSRLASLSLPRGRSVYFDDESGVHLRGTDFYQGEQFLFSSEETTLLGQHNLSNICAALTVLAVLGYDLMSSKAVLRNFQGLPHRLSFVAEKKGVRYINDSISTVPQSAVAAFAAFPEVWLTSILGGYERAQDWDELARGVLGAQVKVVLTLPDSGRKIADAIRRKVGDSTEAPQLIECSSLEEAVSAAAAKTPPGGVVLLSPAAPSYGHFKNFEERGERFGDLVQALPD